ncbi:hypothetical protein D8B26_007521 [Coccidioides posadasii str. Silveira]|uniref:Uncharacterized protein n=1 Tax=Coccidioides posadasii (strain RMSCC 757 / Silveira) TaxID=443226 RepID=E9D257_COCPS|nr:conserved hypothetical protein [Coccidioides posadasii str. Silveira]QVM12905.1 hypothetical protein D8B26_007521 [Coccidioides posadasii str. Silveira]
MMPLSKSVEDSTKTEDKDQHIAAQSADGSLQSAFDQHDEMQTFRHASNKEVPLSCGLEDPFHASLSSIMKGGELSSQHWSPHLSPFHTSETLCSEATQAFDNVSRLSTVDEFTFDSGLLFRGRKETDSRSASTLRQRPTYKYGDLSATDLSNHKSNDYVGSIRKQDSPFELTISPRSSCTMAYQEAWHGRFPSCGQPAGERISISPMPQTAIQRDYITPAVNTRRASEQSASPTQYGSNIVSPTQHSTMPAPCTASFPRCLEHTTPSPIALPSSQTAPMHLLRSQSEGSVYQPWSSQLLDTPLYQYSHHEHQPSDAQTWWGPSSLPNRGLQPYSHSGYAPMLMAPAPQRPQHNRTDHTAVPVHDADLSLHVTQHTELPHVTELSLTVPPLSCPEPPAGPQYPLELAPESLQRPPSFGSSYNSASPSHASSVSPGSTVPPMTPARVTPIGASHRSPKSRQQITNHQRRTNPRKASSFPGISTSKITRTMPVHNTTPHCSSTMGNRNPVTVSFVNFTPEDSQKLLTGVAPSGSSKTKARREQEAREKRRKLSEAALLAVRKAGGDVEALEAVLC